MHLTTAARHLRLRLTIGAVCLAMLPLYATEEAVSRIRRRPYYLPGRLVDRLDDHFIRLERLAIIAGQARYAIAMKNGMDRACDAIDTTLTRLTGRS